MTNTIVPKQERSDGAAVMNENVTFSLPMAMTDTDQLGPLAQVADELGYGAIALPDSVFYPEQVSADYPYSADGSRFWGADTPFVDPFLAISAMAAVTERIRFYTNVYKLPLRNPLLAAKEVSSLAVLSGNRFSLGVGLAWIPEEFAYTGTAKSTRGKRVDEAIDIVREVCAGGGPRWVEHHGEHYDFDRLMISPAPSEPVPILGAGYAEAALRRAAQRCDGWISTQATLAEIEQVTATLLSLRQESERADEAFQISVFCTEAWDLDSFRRLAAIDGVTDIQVAPWYFYGGERSRLDTRIDAMRRFRDEVMSQLR